MNYPVGEAIYVEMASKLQEVEFPVLLQMISLIEDGSLRILPHVTRVKCSERFIDTAKLKLCSSLRTLIVPNCTNITNDVLMALPNIESLTINAINGLCGDVFQHCDHLRTLQIISDVAYNPDTLLDSKTVRYFRNLHHLNIYTNNLSTEDLKIMRNLKTLVIEGSNLSPEIINFLPALEFCVINSTLYKYDDSEESKKKLRKLRQVKKIKIF